MAVGPDGAESPRPRSTPHRVSRVLGALLIGAGTAHTIGLLLAPPADGILYAAGIAGLAAAPIVATRLLRSAPGRSRTDRLGVSAALVFASALLVRPLLNRLPVNSGPEPTPARGTRLGVIGVRQVVHGVRSARSR